MNKIFTLLLMLMFLTTCACFHRTIHKELKITEITTVDSATIISGTNNHLEPALRVQFSNEEHISICLPPNVVRINDLYCESLERIFAFVTEKDNNEEQKYNIYEFYFDESENVYKYNDWFGLSNVKGWPSFTSLVVMDYENYFLYLMSDNYVYKFVESWVGIYPSAEHERFTGIFKVKENMFLLIHTLNAEDDIQSKIVKFDSKGSSELVWTGKQKIVNIIYNDQLGIILVDSLNNLIFMEEIDFSD